MKNNDDRTRLEAVLINLQQGADLPAEDIVFLLGLQQKDLLGTLFQAAREQRRKHFEDRIFLYGFLYTSTYCRNNCTFCYFRRTNTESRRYRKESSEILEVAVRLAESGVHLIDLTMGEDPANYRDNQSGFDQVADLVSAIADRTGLPVMVSPGMVSEAVLQRLARAGADWYACYQETHNRELFQRLRVGQDYDARLATKVTAHRLGLLTEEGLLGGIGETDADVAESLAVMAELACDQIRVMTFVPQTGTPMASVPQPASLRELKIIAVMRLMFPDRLIPASLDVGGLAGLKERLDAGANVVTSLVPSGLGLAGVAQSSLDIEESRRTASSVLPVLTACGLTAATAAQYRSWVSERRKRLSADIPERKSA